MSFRKPCHMPFRKLIPPFTLTALWITIFVCDQQRVHVDIAPKWIPDSLNHADYNETSKQHIVPG